MAIKEYKRYATEEYVDNNKFSGNYNDLENVPIKDTRDIQEHYYEFGENRDECESLDIVALYELMGTPSDTAQEISSFASYLKITDECPAINEMSGDIEFGTTYFEGEEIIQFPSNMIAYIPDSPGIYTADEGAMFVSEDSEKFNKGIYVLQYKTEDHIALTDSIRFTTSTGEFMRLAKKFLPDLPIKDVSEYIVSDEVFTVDDYYRDFILWRQLDHGLNLEVGKKYTIEITDLRTNDVISEEVDCILQDDGNGHEVAAIEADIYRDYAPVMSFALMNHMIYDVNIGDGAEAFTYDENTAAILMIPMDNTLVGSDNINYSISLKEMNVNINSRIVTIGPDEEEIATKKYVDDNMMRLNILNFNEYTKDELGSIIVEGNNLEEFAYYTLPSDVSTSALYIKYKKEDGTYKTVVYCQGALSAHDIFFIQYNNSTRFSVIQHTYTGRTYAHQYTINDDALSTVKMVVPVNNNEEFTPTGDYHLANKKYVDDAIAAGGVDTSVFAPIDSPNFINSISMGRDENEEIGWNSVALGNSTVASGGTAFASGSNTYATGWGSHAEGYYTHADGDYSHAEGQETHATEEMSHAEGYYTYATGRMSHAEGCYTQAEGLCAHAEGEGTLASGARSHAEGYETKATGKYSHAEGSNTIASSENQHVQGKYNIEDTTNTYAHIVGNGTDDDDRSNAHTLDWEGNAWYKGNVTIDGTPTADNDLVTKKYVDEAVANNDGGSGLPLLSSICKKNEDGTLYKQGAYYCLDFDLIPKDVTETYYDDISTSLGVLYSCYLALYKDENLLSTAWLSLRSVYPLVSVGYRTGNQLLSLTNSFQNVTYDLGANTRTLEETYSITSKAPTSSVLTKTNTTEYTPTSDYHPATKKYVDEAIGNIGTGSDIDTDNLVVTNSISIGRIEDTTIGTKSVALGSNVEASGSYSHAEGIYTTASGEASHAEGYNTMASNYDSHAEGAGTEASGEVSHAEGDGTIASGDISHAEGCGAEASGFTSHAEGYGTIASSEYQHVQGKYNIEDSANTYAHIVGNGTDDERSNAHTLDWDGNAWFAGNVKIGPDKLELATKDDIQLSINPDFVIKYEFNSSSLYAKINSQTTTTSTSYAYFTINTNYVYKLRFTTASGEYMDVAMNKTIDNGTQIVYNGYLYTGENSTLPISLQMKQQIGYASVEVLFTRPIETSNISYSNHIMDLNANIMILECPTEFEVSSHVLSDDVEIGNSLSMNRSNGIIGINSTALGGYNVAEGNYSLAEGTYVVAKGFASHAEGYNTVATGQYQHVQGKYNIEDTENKYAHIVGNGSISGDSNAHTLDWNGNAWFAGNVTTGEDNKELATKEYVDDKTEILPVKNNYVIFEDAIPVPTEAASTYGTGGTGGADINNFNIFDNLQNTDMIVRATKFNLTISFNDGTEDITENIIVDADEQFGFLAFVNDFYIDLTYDADYNLITILVVKEIETDSGWEQTFYTITKATFICSSYSNLLKNTAIESINYEKITQVPKKLYGLNTGQYKSLDIKQYVHLYDNSFVWDMNKINERLDETSGVIENTTATTVGGRVIKVNQKDSEGIGFGQLVPINNKHSLSIFFKAGKDVIVKVYNPNTKELISTINSDIRDSFNYTESGLYTSYLRDLDNIFVAFTIKDNTTENGVNRFIHDLVVTDSESLLKKEEILTKANTKEYVPIADYNPATKKYVDDKFAGLQIAQITQAEYDALETKDPNTLYLIVE